MRGLTQPLRRWLVASALAGIALSACGPPPASKPPAYQTIAWGSLVAKGWDPLKPYRSINFDTLSDSDPRTAALQQAMRETWRNAPSNADLQGAVVRIAGYLVPLQVSPAGMQTFLLVPYFGACIHMPPPPSNQVILVQPKQPATGFRAMDSVWVSGTLEREHSDSVMGASSWRMAADEVHRAAP